MTWLRVFASRIRALFGARKLDRDLADELQSHIEMETEANLRRGMSPAEAERAARLSFGGVTQTAEEYRENRGLPFIESVIQDIRYALRGFSKSPGFAAVAILSLGLGIGLNTAFFSMVNMLLLRPLPVNNPAELITLSIQQKGALELPVFSFPDYRDLQEGTAGTLSGILAYASGLDGVSVDGSAERVLNQYVTGNYFTMLGLKPALGRLILPSEGEVEGADPVLVLSYSYWQTRFAGDRAVVGRKVLVNGYPATVIGVAPQGFHGVQAMVDIQGYLPIGVNSISTGFVHAQQVRSIRNLYLLGRLAPGVNVREAESRLQFVANRLSKTYPKDLEGVAFHAQSQKFGRIFGAGPALVATSAIFLTMAALVLVLACMNLANLMIVRAAARQKEIAMRAALGGSRGRLIRQTLTESCLLALFGGAAGLLVAAWTCSALSSWKLQGIPIYLDFSLDGRVLSYAFGAAGFTGFLLGIVPALRMSRADLAMGSHVRGKETGGRQRLRSGLVIAQIAGSFVLLVVAGLLSRSLQNARKIDLGFDPRNVVTFTVDPHNIGYDESHGRRFFHDLLARVRTLPGVELAGLAISGPMSPYPLPVQFQVDGYIPPRGESAPNVIQDLVSAGFFQTLRIPIVRGRAFTESDNQKAPRVAIVNRTAAERFWPGQNPLGRRLDYFPGSGHWMEVVGVVSDTKYLSLVSPPQPYFFVPLEQNYAPIQTLWVRSSGSLDILMQEIQKEIATLAPGLPVAGVETMVQKIYGSQSYRGYRVEAGFATAFGVLGLVLALIGLYGVVSYGAAQRTHEIGVRMALGARASDLRKMIISHGLILVLVGLLAGLALSLAAAPIVKGLLVGVGSTDPLTFFGVSVLLAFVTLAACYLPVRRALRVDPIVVLRHE